MGIKIHDTLEVRGTGEYPLLRDVDMEGGFQVCLYSLDEIKHKKVGMYASFMGLLFKWNGATWDLVESGGGGSPYIVAGQQQTTVEEYYVIGVCKFSVTPLMVLTLKAICRTSCSGASGSMRVYDVTNGAIIIGPVSVTYNSGNYTYIDESNATGVTGTVYYELQTKLDISAAEYMLTCHNATLAAV